MEVPSYKAPKGTEYNPDLGVPSGGPTINQPDIAGPIAGLTKEISRMVIDYQNQKTNTAAKLQKMADDYTLTGNTVAGYTYIVHYKADGINTFAVCLPGRPSVNKKGESIIVPIK